MDAAAPLAAAAPAKPARIRGVQPSAPPAASAANGSSAVGPAPARLLEPGRLDHKAPKRFRARFSTSRGDFVVEVTRAWAPYAADRFYSLVRAGFFDEVRFFAVVKGITASFGIHGHPAVSQAWLKARLLDDIPRISNRRALVSFATVGPLTRTTEVFVNLKDNVALDAREVTPFGVVISGMEVLDKLYAGYGAETQDRQGPRRVGLYTEGNAYLKREFPKLDYVRLARIEG